MNRPLLYICLLGLCGVAQAAKVPVSVTTPTENEDGTALTDLASIEIEWGTCNGAAFGVRQAAVLITYPQVGARLSSFVYPTGLTKVCVRAFAYNSAGAKSDSSNIASKDLLPKPGKPVTLGQPVILSFNKE